MNAPEWLVTTYQWIVYLTPIWGLLLAFLWKPIKNVISYGYDHFVGKPVGKNREGISEHDRRLDEIERRIAHIEEEIEQRIKASRALLHHLIFQAAKEVLERGYITDFELENLEQLYKPYKEIGGDGTAEKLYRDCQQLPVKYRHKEI